MEQDLKVAKNTIFYTSALVLQKVISFVYFALVARFIGVSDVGKYTFALSFATIFAIFIDFGLTSLLIRETAKDQNKSSDSLANILGFKLIIAVIVYIVLCVAVNLLNYAPLTRQLVYISGLVMMMDAITINFYAVLRGHHNLVYESYGSVLNQIVVTIIGLVAIKVGLGLHFLLLAYLGGSIFNFFYALWRLHQVTGIWPKLRLDWPLLKPLIIAALPFLLSGVFARFYGYADIVLLSKMAGDAAVGIYSVAYKLTFAFQFIPLAFMAAVFPAMSSYYVSDQKKLSELFEKSIFYLSLIALPIAGGIFMLAPEIINLVYGPQYDSAVPALRILIVGLFFIFINFPCGSALNASDRQKINTKNLAVVMVCSIILNLFLIPYFNFLGSAIAALGTSVLLVFLGYWQVNKFLQVNWKFLAGSLLKIIFSVVLMMVVLAYFKNAWPLAVSVAVGAIVYAAAAYAVKAVNPLMVREILSLIWKKR